jgi:hypothetical protein
MDLLLNMEFPAGSKNVAPLPLRAKVANGEAIF